MLKHVKLKDFGKSEQIFTLKVHNEDETLIRPQGELIIL